MATLEIEVSELVLRLVHEYRSDRWNQSTLADALGVSRARMMNWINGLHDIDLDRQLQLRLANVLGVTPQQVVAMHGLSVSDEPVTPSMVSALTGPYRHSTLRETHRQSCGPVVLVPTGTARAVQGARGDVCGCGPADAAALDRRVAA